ncbi:type II secretion system minor pseudopilin GspK [Paludibacterium purpuratum]|uniref:Type II secretion system protein K n=1 Tax=Paludibacterium purpuratum TaxID=1144873 RepID=A0A4R7AWW3_9NEIS|nr:type II secretion system minor pseudopilin GspK [Paludibacterium purpuratum]TDR70748.1 type II secretion system protein K (GspK) [Paludibacterium purpuratum]
MKAERGMAVIMALLLVALAASAASLVLWQQSLWWQQVEADRQRAQAQLLLDAQLAWAGLRLRPTPLVALNQPWARPWRGQEGDYRWQADLTDLQSRLNLNALADPQGRINKSMLDSYRRLLTALQLPGALADSLVKWRALRDPDAQDQDPRPVRAVRDWRQLGEVPGYAPQVLRVLAPYVALLPSEFNLVNLNTASPQLLAAMVQDSSLGTIAQVVQGRERLPFRDASDFFSRLGRRPDDGAQQMFGAGSSIFLLSGTVRYHTAVRRIDAILKVEAGRVRVLARPDRGALPPLS